MQKYSSNSLFTDKAMTFMQKQNIIPDGMLSEHVCELLTARFIESEYAFQYTEKETEEFIVNLLHYMQRGVCMFGTPMLTNITNGVNAFASCSAIPISKLKDIVSISKTAEEYYILNMGTGLNLNNFKDPLKILKALNEHAEAVEVSGKCSRYIGNIAHVSVDHPKVQDFIKAKYLDSSLRHFNLSIDVSQEFMMLSKNGASGFNNLNYKNSPAMIWKEIVEHAWICGDPGIISLQRFNQGNPLVDYSPYITVAPCAEVGLSVGETCHFAYINIAACIRYQERDIDFELIGEVTDTLTRALDNLIESGCDNFPNKASAKVTKENRKIAIGICGYADTLLYLGFSYGSKDALKLLSNVLTTIQYRSKKESMKLAVKRGAFPAFSQSTYANHKTCLAKYKKLITDLISEKSWSILVDDIKKFGIRNVMTTALPPSGRTSHIFNASPSIEPFLYKEHISQKLEEAAGNNVISKWVDQYSGQEKIFRIATEIPWIEHLSTLEVAAVCLDDSISKTVNLPVNATVNDVDNVYHSAWDLGLKAISVYRKTSGKDTKL